MIYEQIITLEKQYSDQRRNNAEQHEETIIRNKKRVKIISVIISLILIPISVLLGVFLGKTVLAHEVLGYNTVCYYTDYGDAYHNGSCGALWNSKNQTSVYRARRMGLKPCMRCNVGPLDTSIKQETAQGVVLTVFATCSLSAFMIIGIYIKRQNRVKLEKERTDVEIDQTYSNEILNIINSYGVLNIVHAPENVRLSEGNITSDDMSYYRYVSEYGKCYHSNPKCNSNILKRIWAFDIQKLEPCRKCAVVIDIPEWYTRFKRLQGIKQRHTEMLLNSEKQQRSHNI